jgi:hypothetical protein
MNPPFLKTFKLESKRVHCRSQLSGTLIRILRPCRNRRTSLNTTKEFYGTHYKVSDSFVVYDFLVTR